MCGIAGVISFQKKPFSILKKMTDLVDYRGPDDYGYMCYDITERECETGKGISPDYLFNIGLGHRRLSIIDLSEKGCQPIKSPDGQYWIIYNGEVYNYIELRENLKKEGSTFSTDTDTEVILNAYMKYGAECFNLFNGMWALAIFDLNKMEMVLSRDRFGIKPLYYYYDSNTFLFSSEIKQLLVYPAINRNIDKGLLNDYLGFGKIENPGGSTLFEHIKALQPSYSMKIKITGDRLRYESKRFYNIKIDSTLTSSNEGTLSEQFMELFKDSIKLRLRSDVEIGSCISGGMDSTSIASLASEQLHAENNRFRGVNFFYKGKTYDEREYVRLFAHEQNTEISYVTFSIEEMKNQIEKIIWHQDMPFVSTSIFAQWSVFRKAKEIGLKVMLDGQGADELFGGDDPFFYSYFLELLGTKNYKRLTNELFFYFLYHRHFKLFFSTLWNEIKKDRIKGQKSSYSVPEGITGRFNRDCYSHLTYGNLESLLRYEDRNSMSHSIETRLPFLDFRIVNFIMSLSSSLKIKGGYTKHILRNCMINKLPDKIRMRQNKMGFTAPMNSFIKRLIKDDNELSYEIKTLNNSTFLSCQRQWRLVCYVLWKRAFKPTGI